MLRRLRVPDIAPPTVLIASPGANVQIDPRAPLAVSVDAGDNSGIAQVSFTASELRNQEVQVDPRYVKDRLADLVKDEDLSKFIL